MKPLIVFSLLTLISSTLDAADVFLIENGLPQAGIVISEKPARMTKLAAKELQTYLEKISGAKLEIVTQPQAGKIAIYVGKSEFTDKLKLVHRGTQQRRLPDGIGAGLAGFTGAGRGLCSHRTLGADAQQN